MRKYLQVGAGRRVVPERHKIIFWLDKHSVSDKMILLVFINPNCKLSLKGWINNTEEEQQQKTGEILNKSALVF